ncbi:MAG: hypothetical protein JO284_12985 [Planctomycetaceae bacterium]|nr:hypothetical protein [Planctomycetaceae bacterium]
MPIVYRSGGGYKVTTHPHAPPRRLPYAVRRPDGQLLARCADRLLAQALVDHLDLVPAPLPGPGRAPREVAHPDFPPDPEPDPAVVDLEQDEFGWSSADQPDPLPHRGLTRLGAALAVLDPGTYPLWRRARPADPWRSWGQATVPGRGGGAWELDAPGLSAGPSYLIF